MRVSIDRRCLKALVALSSHIDYITIEELSSELEQTRRRTQYDLCKINDLLKSANLQPVISRRNRGIKLDEDQKEWVKELQGDNLGKYNYIYTQEERCAIIICEYVLGNRTETMEDIVDRLMVSKNTAFLDLKLAKEKLKVFKISYKYNRKNGHRVNGDEILKRSVFMYYISVLYPIISEGIIEYLEDEVVKSHLDKLKEIESEIGISFSNGTIEKLAIMLGYCNWDSNTTIKSISSGMVVNVDEEHVKNSYIYGMVNKIYHKKSESDKVYISIHLLSGRLKNDYYDIQQHEKLFNELAVKLIKKFERAVGIDMEERELLIYNLSMHISHSIYRYAYGIIDFVGIEQEVRKNSEELFEIVKAISKDFSKDIGFPINDSEAAYLSIHFSAHMRRTKSSYGKTKILLVCDELEKGLELQRKIEFHMPMLYVVGCVLYQDFQDFQDFQEYSMIISTLLLKYNGFYSYISYHLDDTDRRKILQVYMECKAWHNEDVSLKLFNKLKPYITRDNYNNVKLILDECLIPKRLNLLQLLDKNNLLCMDAIDNWRDAISQAAMPLLEREYIDETYIDSMIMSIELYGMYSYFGNGVFLAHAKTKNNVYRSGVAIMTLKKGVRFRDKKIVTLIIVLASINENEHFNVLKEAVKLCNKKEKVDRLLACRNEDELFDTVQLVVNE